MQRRLSSNKPPDRRIEEIRRGIDHLSDVDDREWTPVVRPGSIDRTTPPALETVTQYPNGRQFVPVFVPTSNTFGVLNNSLHDDPTPIKERSLNYHLSCLQDSNYQPHSAKKLKFSPEVDQYKPIQVIVV